MCLARYPRFHFTILENQVEIRPRRVNRSSFMINQSSFASRRRVQLTCTDISGYRISRDGITLRRGLSYAGLCARSLRHPPSVLQHPREPVHPARFRLFGERVVETRGSPRFPTVLCFGQIASCINHTSGEHKMFVARPTSRKRNNSCTQQRKLSSRRLVSEFQLNLLKANLNALDYYLATVLCCLYCMCNR